MIAQRALSPGNLLPLTLWVVYIDRRGFFLKKSSVMRCFAKQKKKERWCTLLLCVCVCQRLYLQSVCVWPYVGYATTKCCWKVFLFLNPTTKKKNHIAISIPLNQKATEKRGGTGLLMRNITTLSAREEHHDSKRSSGAGGHGERGRTKKKT